MLHVEIQLRLVGVRSVAHRKILHVALVINPLLDHLFRRCEAAYVFLFGQAGVDVDQALALALAYDATLVITGLIGAALYIIQGMKEIRR